MVHDEAPIVVQDKSARLVDGEKAPRPYKKHPKLHQGRKPARIFPRQTLSYLDFPTELRVRIYRYAFIMDPPVEFWAEVDCYGNARKQRSRDAEKLRSAIASRKLNLDFLRTCRRAQFEGSEVFYGENEFRFSGVSGHIIANLFVRKVSTEWLTSLTIAMPIHSTYSGQSNWRSNKYTYNDPNNISYSDTEDRRRNPYGTLPFPKWLEGGHFEFDGAFKHLAWNLSQR